MCEWKLEGIASDVMRMEAKAPRHLLGDLYGSNEKNTIVSEDGEKGSVGPHE
jgi:hypothetical protein